MADPDNTPSTNGQSVLPDDIRESIALGSFAAITGQPSSLSNLAYSNAIGNNNLTQQNTVANQQAMNQVAQAVLGNTVNLVADVSPMEAVAAVKLDTGNDVAEQLADLKGTIAAFTPPPPQPSPVPPLSLSPIINLDPQGKINIIAGRRDLPLTIVIDDNISTYQVVPDSPRGKIINVNSRHFPVKIVLQGGTQTEPQIVFDVQRNYFPVEVKIGSSPAGHTIQEIPNRGTILTVNREKFPIKVNIAP